MNKWLMLTAGSLLAMNVQAESFCGYKDFFHLSNKTNQAITIANGYSDQDIILQFVGPRSFVIRDSYPCRAGYAHVTVADDKGNWCALDIKDGPYMYGPTLSASCNGMSFLTSTYDGFGTNSYTLDFE